jgi:hypothetical protein
VKNVLLFNKKGGYQSFFLRFGGNQVAFYVKLQTAKHLRQKEFTETYFGTPGKRSFL